ncbi:MAG TPA: HEPN domain-containing protein [Gemmataceae bacterium]|nr:HEPN domain-containing protein [Gemmataceae bacterium]
MDETGFLDLADELSTGSRQASWRSATSRAYYAAFHKARTLLLRSGFTVPRAERAHSYLWLRLSNCAHPDVVYTGKALRDLNIARNHADYDVEVPVDHAECIDHIGVAMSIIQLLHHLANEPAVLMRVLDAIKIYARCPPRSHLASVTASLPSARFDPIGQSGM